MKRTRQLLTGVVPAVWLGILALLVEGLFSRPSPAEEPSWHVGPVLETLREQLKLAQRDPAERGHLNGFDPTTVPRFR